MKARSNLHAIALRVISGTACLLLGTLAWAAPGLQRPRQTNSFRLSDTNRASLTITTNFYRFGGTNQAQMVAAMIEARPWKRTQTFDALTKWDVTSKYRFRRREGRFVLDDVEVQTKVVMTFPWWIPGKPVPRDLVERWNRCFIGLVNHEVGHLTLAEAAGNEVKKQLLALAPSASFRELSAAASSAITNTIEQFHSRERLYDKVTRHGFTQGAVFAPDQWSGTGPPGQSPRGRHH